MDVESSQIGLVADDGAEQWCVPFGDIIKVNVDAAIFGESHSFGVGMVAHDSHGFLLEGCTQLFQRVVRPEIVEAIGVLEALSWIKRNQWQEVFLETDCLVVVQALRSSVAMLSLFGSIIEECENLLVNLENIVIYFVKRSTNSVACSFARTSSLYLDRSFSLGNILINFLACLVPEVNL
ncbi:hypothetical protein CsatA_003703 [Cannabis sativa]